MNREEVQLLGFEIVAYAGDARSKLLEALKAAEASDFAKAEALVEEAANCIAEAQDAESIYKPRRPEGPAGQPIGEATRRQGGQVEYPY